MQFTKVFLISGVYGPFHFLLICMCKTFKLNKILLGKCMESVYTRNVNKLKKVSLLGPENNLFTKERKRIRLYVGNA